MTQNPDANASLRRNIALAVVATLIWLLALEGLARLFVSPQDAQIHREHASMITVLGLPSLNATMEFDPTLFWQLRDGLRDHLVEGEVRGTPISFRVSTTDRMRSPALGPKGDVVRILALGDSCTFGLGVEDDETWPAQLQAMLAERGVAAEVVNAGVPGYTAFQGLRWLEARAEELDPDLLIVSFGFNDRDLWSSRSDLETARSLQVPRWESVASRSRLYIGMRRLLRPGPPEPVLPEDPAAAKAALRARLARGAVPRLSPDEFADVLGQIEASGRARGSGVIFATWPFRSQVDQGLRQTVRYQTLQEQVARRLEIPLVHLAPAFIDAGGALFVDHVHASPAGNRVAARAMLPAVLKAIGRE